MKFIFDCKFRFYTSKMNGICLHYHLLLFFFNHIEFWTMWYPTHTKKILNGIYYRCVPEYACKDGDVIVNTPRPIHSQLSRMMLLFYNEYSKCPGQDEICCQHQDWKNVPLESSVVIKKPLIDCRANSIKSVNIKG